MPGTSSDCLMIFVKYPALGAVKSRLAAAIGDKAAVALYRHFVLDTLKIVEDINAEKIICYTPNDAAGLFRDWLGESFSYHSQGDGDLGVRLDRAFSDCFARGYDRCIVIGSDSPDMPAELIRTAFERLHTHDAVIGPADDGGYYLLGFNRDSYYADTFADIPWSADNVFIETMSALESGQRHVFSLPRWSDVDFLADLEKLVKRNVSGDFARSGTMKYIKKYIFPDR